MIAEFNSYDAEIAPHDRMTIGKHMPPLVYYALKLNGEAGEVAERVGKAYRDNDGNLTPEIRHEILLELGDCLWYMSRIACLLGFSLARVASENIYKLSRRRVCGKNAAAELEATINRSLAA